MAGLIVFIIFLLIIFSNFIKLVPANTAIIVDRNHHYLKTKKKGFYFFNPATDKITTYISTNPHTQSFIQISESHDGLLFQLGYHVVYKASNVNQVLESLKSNRRSVNDIIQSCVHTSVANFEKTDLVKLKELIEEIKRRLSINLESFEITLISFDMGVPYQVPNSARKDIFAPHISEGIRSIKYK